MKILNIYTQTVKIIQVWNGMPPVNDTKKVFLEGGGGGGGELLFKGFRSVY